MRWQVLSHKSWSSKTICKYYILSSYHPVPWSHSSNTIVSDGRQSHQTSSFMSAFKHQKINSNQHLATTFHMSNPASTALLEVKFQYNAQPTGANRNKKMETPSVSLPGTWAFFRNKRTAANAGCFNAIDIHCSGPNGVMLWQYVAICCCCYRFIWPNTGMHNRK